MHRHSPLSLALTAALAGWTPGSLAQPSIEEVIVSADFRNSQLQNLPASASVLDEALIASRNALHLEDVLLNAPNVNLAAGSSRARFYQIRGIGERSQYAEPLNASVGVLIDGVDFSGIGAAAMLYDVEQVEVLMGPQGTRYGSNALAGLINLQSRAPTEETAFGLQLQGENHGGRGLGAYASGALAPELLGRISLQSLESDGFSHNTWLDKPTNTRDELTARGKLQWLPGNGISADLSLGHVDIDNGYDTFSLDNNRETRSDEPGFDRQQSTWASLRVDIERFDRFRMKVLAAIADSDIGYGYDEDWTWDGFHPDGYASTDHYFRDQKTHSAELRLLSTPEGALLNGRTSWTAGLYLLDQELDTTRDYTYADGPFSNRYGITRTALYGDTSTELAAQWSLDAGLRIEHVDAAYRDSNALRFAPDDVLAGGRLSLNYRSEALGLLYASVSRGYKVGGFNIDGSLDEDLREYGEEKLWNYEIGFKGNLLHDRLRTRLALFFMDRDEVQVNSFTTRVRADNSEEFIQYTGNAAAGFNRGLELGFEWLSNGDLSAYGSLGLLDSEYEDFINSEGDDLDGRAQAQAPDYQYTLGLVMRLLPELSLDVNVQGRDAFYFSDSHNGRSNNYNLLNASLAWQWQNATLRLWGRNLLDKDYAVRGFFFGNDPRDGYTDKVYRQWGEPQRYGITLNVDF